METRIVGRGGHQEPGILVLFPNRWLRPQSEAEDTLTKATMQSKAIPGSELTPCVENVSRLLTHNVICLRPSGSENHWAATRCLNRSEMRALSAGPDAVIIKRACVTTEQNSRIFGQIGISLVCPWPVPSK